MIGYWISALGLAVGAGMGLYGLINPRWAAGLVRLRDDPDKPGGFAEFRATYGGLFFATHLIGLLGVYAAARHSGPLGYWNDMGQVQLGLGAIVVCGAMWVGTAIGRGVSMLADGTATRFNQGSLVFELVLGLVILAPWFVMQGG